MRGFGVIAMLPLAVIALVACVGGVHDWLYPPFSDQEIRDSFVDTWEPSAWATMFVLVVLAFVAAVASVVAILVTSAPGATNRTCHARTCYQRFTPELPKPR
jgi:hypothetical protein